MSAGGPAAQRRVSQTMLRDNEVLIDMGRATDGSTFVRVLHIPTGRSRTSDRLGGESDAAVVSRLRLELEADLLAAGLGQHVEPDSQPGLVPFWITPASGTARRDGCTVPIGFGVTARSLEDAVAIVRDAGYDLPLSLEGWYPRENITVEDLNDTYVLRHMGPIVVRGLWYPFRRVGTAVP